MKTLIFTQVHLKDESQGKLFGVCMDLIRRLNPEADLLVIDNASPLPPHALQDCHVLRFRDAIGHFSPTYKAEHETPQDGPGRAMTTALTIAHNLGYRKAVYHEADCLFAHPVEHGFAQMKHKVGFLPRTKYGYLDNQVWWFADLPWLVKECRYPERYDWQTQTGRVAGEVLHEKLTEGHLDILPYRGCRGETIGLNETNMREHFPDGIDFVTHVDEAAWRLFLEINGHPDLARKL